MWYNLAELLPPVYRAIVAMKESADITNESLLESVEVMQQIQSNFFVQTCDETTLIDWENRLQIEANELDSLEYRRRRVMAYMNNTTPYTHCYWVDVLNFLIGEGEWTLTVKDNEIMLAVTDQTPEYRIKQMLNWASRVKPAHVAFFAGWRYKTQPINSIACTALVGATTNVSCKVPLTNLELFSITNWDTYTRNAVYDMVEDLYTVGDNSYSLSALIDLDEVPRDEVITVYNIETTAESLAYKYFDKHINETRYLVKDGSHVYVVEADLEQLGWSLTPIINEKLIYGIMQEDDGADVQLYTPNSSMNIDQEMVEILGETGIIPAPTYYIYLAYVGYKSISGVSALRTVDSTLGLSQAKAISDGVYETKQPYMLKATLNETDAQSAIETINAVPGYYAVIRTVNVSPEVIVQRE